MALRTLFRVSERFACRVVGQHRSTQRHGGRVVDTAETKLRQRLREIAAEHIRWGRRMAYRLLRREGWRRGYLAVFLPFVHRVLAIVANFIAIVGIFLAAVINILASSSPKSHISGMTSR